MSNQTLEIPALVEQFHRDGYLVLPSMLSPDYVAELFEGVQKDFAEYNEESALYGETMQRIWRPKMFEHGEAFERLIDYSPAIDLVEAILGNDCHIIANSALRTGPGDGISGWHADEAVRFPRPKGVPLDPRIPSPCFIVNLNYYLCDVDEELGPTEFIPGSHRSGRQPDAEDRDANGDPSYEGKGVFRAVGPAGTIVLWHDQTWHRGAPNRSKDRTRWVQQAPYGKRYISQRFYPFLNYQMPAEILERANPRRKRLLGVHGLGAYG
ncbi:MAG: phytanoyl-CoA dioxygenase family protein [Armatimonadetes bacterium]|nr:phytanoyl-CoA dioxygenase family protein [Armatimonadota bacterium]